MIRDLFAQSALSLVAVFLVSCQPAPEKLPVQDSATVATIGSPEGPSPELKDTSQPMKNSTVPAEMLQTGTVTPDRLMNFAESLLNTPYVYGSSDPEKGFDCSGFIYYVFKNFGIEVPRSSVDFLNIGITVPVSEAKRGDIILFTGTDGFDTNIGHMGLVVSNKANDSLRFIHSTSGKAMAVTITPLNAQYTKRFVRVGRIFEE